MQGVFVWKGPAGAHQRLVWLGEQATADFWSHFWPGPLREAVEDARRHRVLLDILLRYSRPGGRVLEGGCGRGQWVVVLRERGRDAVGTDFDTATLSRTRQDAELAPPRLTAGDVRWLPFPDGAFDTYISLGVAEHFLPGPEAVLREARRVLRPDGYLLISVPRVSPLRQLRARAGAYRSLGPQDPPAAGFYQFAFQAEEFAGLLSEAGFTVLEAVPFSARAGLAQEIPLASRLHRLVKGANGRRPGPGDAAAGAASMPGEPTPPGGVNGRASRNGAATAKTLSSWLVNTYPVRWFAGHMVLFAAQRQP